MLGAMDSKYSSIGGGVNKKKFTLSLKRHVQSSIKPKNILKLQCSPPTTTNYLQSSPSLTQINTPAVVVNRMDTSESILEQRRKLPVFAVRYRLLDEIKKNSTLIIIGETGSGKTTQIPQLLHEIRHEGAAMIAVTQPRRVAAITIAMRVAKEMQTNIGDIVGYSVRFEDVTSNRTKLKYLTDGMLLREAMGDPLLTKYSIIILDEAHERTVSSDVLFGIVKLAQKERKEKNLLPLKIIVMSATMDVDAFRSYFDECPVIYLEGRTHPVTIYYAKNKLDDHQHAALCTIFQLHANTPIDHDFLVFMTGQEEIETLSYNIKQIAKEQKGGELKVCPLYAGLPHGRQLEAWRAAPPGARKVVLATNIAETSVTIPNVKCVIDTGLVKERTWCAQSGAERLRVCACARAACWQRAGRAGRDAPGAAYRLYTRADMEARPAQQVPEILRCPLSSTVLWMVAVGVQPATFPLLSPPPEATLQATLTALHQLGAIDNVTDPKLTALGKKMSMFPIEPKYAKVILSATEYECLDEVLSIVAVLSSENIFHSPIHKREDALRAKQKFVSPLGDHITLLNVYNAFTKATLKKQWCKENYVHHRNVAYAGEVRAQLAGLARRLLLPPSSCGSAHHQVVRCLLTGLRSQCARWRGGAGGAGGGRYVTAGGAAARLHPASVLHAARPAPPALLYTELLTTHATYLSGVSALEPAWLTGADHAEHATRSVPFS